MKSLLFHAIEPDPVQRGSFDWNSFLREAALAELPEGVERLARNVWLLPDDQTYLILSRIGHRWSIATRILPFVHGSDWQSLSTPP
jgi:hypothetical protein